jgi:hypothetical protein
VDDTSSYACSASDTCSSSTLDYGQTDNERQNICGACPRTAGGEVNQYGCDTYSKQCTCSRPNTVADRCTTNSECEIQGSDPTHCALVNDFTTGASYGTLQCQACPSTNTPVCLISDRSNVGRCSCLLQSQVTMQKCSDVGTRGFPDAAGLCAISTDTHATSKTNVISSWPNLAVIPCALMGVSSSVCSRTPGMGDIVVMSRSSNNRRLLSEDQGNPVWTLQDEFEKFTDWNHTADPCKMLANAYASGSHISITEEAQLEWCVRQRIFGNSTILQLNLTSMVSSDHFLLSLQDFVSCATHKGVLQQLMKTPGLVKYFMTHNTWIVLCSDLFRSFAQTVGIEMEKHTWPTLNTSHNTSSTRDNSSEFVGFVDAQIESMRMIDPTSLTSFVTREEKQIATDFKDTIHTLATKQNIDEFIEYTAEEIQQSFFIEYAAEEIQPSFFIESTTDENVGPTNSRRLLEIPNAVSRYSTLTAETDGFSNIAVGSTLADNWLEGPYSSPSSPSSPKAGSLFALKSARSCSAVEISLDVTGETLLVMSKFFDDYKSRAKVRSWSLLENAPTFYNGSIPSDDFVEEFPASKKVSEVPNDWAASFFKFVGENVAEKYLKISKSSIMLFLSDRKGIPRDLLTARNLMKDALVCDFEAVMICTKHNR